MYAIRSYYGSFLNDDEVVVSINDPAPVNEGNDPGIIATITFSYNFV